MDTNNKIKLISLNVELNRHYGRVFPFLEREKPDVCCLAEVLEKDFPLFEKTLNMKGKFAPMATLESERYEENIRGEVVGVAMFSALEADYSVHPYVGSPDHLPKCVTGYEDNKIFIHGSILAGDKNYSIGVTHFTWTPNGQTNDQQRDDLKKLFQVLDNFPDIVFCGDFNAPRGREIWGEIAKKYKDNIPPEYETSLDPNLHRAGPLSYVVDGLFSTPEYVCSGTRLVSGVSDHMAIVSEIRKI